jgi:predicted ATP-dependent endonuclease of OLD family
MQKIVIENFGPIQNAEIVVSKVLVLIGEQASGKSTIAKLIYFFKSIGDVFFENFYSSPRAEYDTAQDIKKPIRTKFYDFFGSTKHLPDFNIKYFYETEKEKYLELKLGQDRSLIANFSPGFFSRSFKQAINEAKRAKNEIEERIQRNALDLREKISLEQEKLHFTQKISQLIDNAYVNLHTSSLFVIAGRESTVSYEATFEAYLENTLSSFIQENRKRLMMAKQQTIDETLMLSFLQEVRRIKGVFRKYGGKFRDVIDNLSGDGLVAENVLEKISEILKGEYVIDQSGEKIIFRNNQYIYLKDTSSGQKETIRILQDLILCILERQTVLRIIEEPEAHLFPVAQKQLIELLVFMKNANPNNQLIITTHSPYILTVINNLLFSHRVIAANPNHREAVENLIPSTTHINPADFSAYSLGSTLAEGRMCESIFNPRTGVIKQNFLDTVSDILGNDFRYLYSLHAQTIA